MRHLCDYARCMSLASADADGFQFCTPHLHEHRQFVAEEAAAAREAEALRARVSGYLLPSCSYGALLAALHPKRHVQAGAA